MLVLTRRIGESFVINGNIKVRVLNVYKSGNIRIGIDAPRDISINRSEIQDRIDYTRKLFNHDGEYNVDDK